MSSRAEATHFRRRAILDAARSLLVERGLAATSVEDIRAASGASVGSIYHHFGSKENIAVALYIEAVADYQAGAVRVLRSAPDTELGVRRVVRHYLDWVEKHPDDARLMLDVEHVDVRSPASEDVKRLNADFAARLEAWVAERGDAPFLRALGRDLRLAVLLGPARRYAELWLQGAASTPMRRAKETLAAAAWASVSAGAR